MGTHTGHGAGRFLKYARRFQPQLLALTLFFAISSHAKAEENGAYPVIKEGAGAGQPAPVDERKVLLQADTVTYDSETNIVTAKGNVEGSYGERILLADTLSYNERTGLVVAQGNVAILEPSGEVLMADRVELTEDLKTGVIDSFSALLAGEARFAARQAQRRDGKVSTLEYAVYSPCRVCRDDPDDEPLWQVRARRVVHDTEAQEISYKHATLEVWGVPVLYVPVFSHPDPSVKRKSGFLTPTIGSDSELGYLAEIPYYWAIAPNRDLTIAPLITTREGVAMKSEYRHRFQRGEFEVAGSLTYSDEFGPNDEDTGDETVRGHFFGKGLFEFKRHWRWGFDVKLTSDDTYMRRYNISGADRLTSNAFVSRFDDRDYTRYDAFYFQGLREEDDPGQTPIVPAMVEHRTILDRRLFGGEVSATGNLLILQRTEGADSRRVSGSLEWKRREFTSSGMILEGFGEVRGDLYHTDDVNRLKTPGGPKNTEVIARALPTFGMEWRWPFVRSEGATRIVFEPIAQLIYSSYGGNPEDIPDEDAVSFEFDDTNLFRVNKFPGLDRWESGPRANVGIELASYFDNGGTASVLFGQSFRTREDTTFDPSTGLDNERSDYVGRVSLAPVDWLDFVHRFRLDSNDFEYKRAEVYARAGGQRSFAKLGYVKLDEELSQTGLDAREEINAESRVALTDTWSVYGDFRRDMEKETMISQSAGVAWENECIILSVGYRRRFTRDRDVEPSTSVLLRLDLKTFSN